MLNAILDMLKTLLRTGTFRIETSEALLRTLRTGNGIRFGHRFRIGRIGWDFRRIGRIGTRSRLRVIRLSFVAIIIVRVVVIFIRGLRVDLNNFRIVRYIRNIRYDRNFRNNGDIGLLDDNLNAWLVVVIVAIIAVIRISRVGGIFWFDWLDWVDGISRIDWIRRINGVNRVNRRLRIFRICFRSLRSLRSLRIRSGRRISGISGIISTWFRLVFL